MDAVSSAITAMMHFVSSPSPAWKRAILAHRGGESLGLIGVFCAAADIDGRGMGRIVFIVAMQFRVNLDDRYDLQRAKLYGT